ncbi:MAG: ethanolamine ammonia-lyase subunit EutC [Deltaproteobacteria bacterium]|nr:ethanolamine ammonia-lyase subunit EutC [Deltaproteobacteria bacterium]
MKPMARASLSRTRALIDALRTRLGAADPMPPRPAVPVIPAPPAHVFPTPARRGRYAADAARHTTALVGIGHVGTRYATDVVLQFKAELAVAHEAVAAELPAGWFEQQGYLGLHSQARDHREFLLRPDLGRRLDEDSLQRLRARGGAAPDVQIILADGLSAVACQGSGVALCTQLADACRARGWSVGAPVGARFARVWLEDEIGEVVGAKVAVIVLGERPGLGTGDGLSAYLVHAPRIGNVDGQRNMMSNIHARGTPPAQAARRLAALIGAMLAQGTSGVGLDLAGIAELDGLETGYRAPQVRERLVEVG